MKKLRIRLPTPHDKQREIEACTATRVVVGAGRRAGKTTMCARKAIKKANNGTDVLYAAPISTQTNAFWKKCVTWLAPAIKTGLVKKNETHRTLTFVETGAVITARTAFKPDHLRGDGAGFLILDEYAYQNPEVWNKVCMPMLLDCGGEAWFISTPDKRNHFFILYMKAQVDERWVSFSFSSLDNPHLSKEALAELIEDMTDEDYRQEILAEFVLGEGSVFRLYREDFISAKKNILEIHKGHRIVAGLDWAKQKDFTVLDVGCATCQMELETLRFNQIDYIVQRDRIKGVYDRYKAAGFEMEILGESNSIGLPNIEQLREDGVPVIEFYTSSSSKAIAVQGLRLAFAQRAWKWLYEEVSWRELEMFEMKLTPKGNVTYSAPKGFHDDCVIAKMLMLHQAITGTFTLA